MKKLFVVFLFIFQINAFAFYQADVIDGQVLTDELAVELGMIPADELGKDGPNNNGQIKVLDREGDWRSGPDENKAEVVVIVDKAKKGASETAQTARVYYKGDLYKTYTVSTGKEKMVTTTSGKQYLATTPLGYFRPKTVWKRYQSSTFVGADMDFAVFFNGGIALHSTIKKYFPQLGQRASGGCVRFKREDAQEVNELILSTGLDSYEIKPRNRKVGNRTVLRHKVVGGDLEVLGVYRNSGVIYNETTVKSWDTLIIVKDFSR